jgi:hypothetical protein
MRGLKKTAILAAALVGIFAGTAGAEERLVAKVPFSFVLRGEQFPAGRYEIRTDMRGIASVRGMDNRAASFAFTMPADGHDPVGADPALVFTEYENTYRLSEIWLSDEEGQAIESSASAKPRAMGRAAMAPAAGGVASYVVAASRP